MTEEKKNIVIPPKKPKLSKAERRALQEAQRAAKGQGQGTTDEKNEQHQQKTKNEQQQQQGNKKDIASSSESTTTDEKEKKQDQQLGLFSHLTPYKDRSKESHISGVTLHAKNDKYTLHPCVLRLGIQYANGSIRGSNNRCRSMMECFKTVIESSYNFDKQSSNYSKHTLSYDLFHTIIRPSFDHWTTKCRPHCITMGNAFAFLKRTLQQNKEFMDDIDNVHVSIEEVRILLIQLIDTYVQERITFADLVIADYATKKIQNGDVILIFGYSETIDIVLDHAAKSKEFRVIIVDSRPLYEGKKHLNNILKLNNPNIQCTYILYNALSYVIMNQVTKVLLGASGLMSDGCVLSRIGTAGIALLAHSSNNIPVLVCCETYKITHRVQLDSFTENELGDPTKILNISTNCMDDYDNDNDYDDDKKESCNTIIKNSASKNNLHLVHLTYDLTSNHFVSGIITEMGILPPTSVAVLLREMNVFQQN